MSRLFPELNKGGGQDAASCPPLIKLNPARIGFDFDGVIADTAESFLRIACEDYGLCGLRLEDITCFEVEACLNVPAATVDAIFGTILEDSLSCGLQPMPGAMKVLAEVAEAAGVVTVVTARPLLRPVLDWFAHHLPQPALSAVRVVAMGDHDDKARHIAGHGLEYFIDDRAETCVQLQQAGIRPLLFRQPWNQDCRHFPAVRSWQEIRDLCLDV